MYVAMSNNATPGLVVLSNTDEMSGKDCRSPLKRSKGANLGISVILCELLPHSIRERAQEITNQNKCNDMTRFQMSGRCKQTTCFVAGPCRKECVITYTYPLSCKPERSAWPHITTAAVLAASAVCAIETSAAAVMSSTCGESVLRFALLLATLGPSACSAEWLAKCMRHLHSLSYQGLMH